MKKKKLIIGAGALAVVLGGVAVAGQAGAGGSQIASVTVTEAHTGDVEQVVDATGTVVSDEKKTFFSPVNAEIQTMSFEQGDTIKKGTKLIEFDLTNLERDNQKATLNLKSGNYDYQNAINKSEDAQKKQSNAKESVKSLEDKVSKQKDYVASLKSQLAAVNAQAQADSAAAAQAQAAEAQAQAQAQAEAQAAAAQAKNQEIQRAYSAALTTYQNETLPAYQAQLAELSAAANQALSDYNQADLAYQMAFINWQADPTEEKAQALNDAEQTRSNAQIADQQASEAYNNLLAQPPVMPLLSDFTTQAELGDFVTDGTEAAEVTDASVYTETSAGSSYVAPNTSGLENALEQASSDLAELQSDLASKKAVAEADSTSLTKEEKEKMKLTNNLSELDSKSAKELVEEGKKGLTAEFNGVISKAAVVEGATVSQGMELFTLENTDKVSVDINVSKYDYDKVKEGNTAEISLGDYTYEGTVTKISHMAVPNEKGTPLISAEVSINQPDENIFLGVDAKVKVHTANAEGVLLLPVEVINVGKNGSFCYVLEDGVIVRKDITIGINSDEYVEIKDGLSGGEQVITDIGSLEEGMQAQAFDGTGLNTEE